MADRGVRTVAALLIALATFGAGGPLAAAAPKDESKNEWKPIDPAVLAETSPVVEKDADAEVVLWEVRIEGGLIVPTVSSHYLRIKVFTERGAQQVSQVDLPYVKLGGKDAIADVAARTIKPDGTIVELKKDAIFDRTIVQTSGVKVNSRSFALPAVVPGAVVEYRWREASPLPLAFFTHLAFQRTIPVRNVTYHIRGISLPGAEFRLRTLTFHGHSTPFEVEPDGFVRTVMTNVPAYHAEPFMPPEDEVRTWMLVYPALAENTSPESFWPELGRRSFEYYAELLAANDDVRKAATAAVGDASSPDAKLERLFQFCRTTIKNTQDDASGLSIDALSKLKQNKSPADTLKRRYGTRADINRLFVALATSVGLDARIALVADRSASFFDPKLTGPFLTTHVVAVHVDGAWRFFDPGSPYVPFGMLQWRHEAQQALVLDASSPQFVRTPLTPAAASAERRAATLKLDGEGAVEGDVRIELTGHVAMERREEIDDATPEAREQVVKREMADRLAGATVSNVVYENVTDAAQPLVLTFHVRAPGYAQRTGQRLFLRPSFFEAGRKPTFEAATRRHEVYFHYPWSEHDAVTIEVPDGFSVEPVEPVDGIPEGLTASYGAHVTVDGPRLTYERSFAFGSGDRVLFNQGDYLQLKALFDSVRQKDDTLVSLQKRAP